MRWQALLLLLAAYLAAALTACALHPGGEALAFIRAGQLWTIQADGSNAHQIAQGQIVGFAWSPDHHQLVFRTATSKDVAPPALPPATAPDAPGDLYVTSINGGAPLQISSSLGLLARSDAWWNPDGNRLLYRESFSTTSGTLSSPTYVASQADQPLGLASKTLLDTASLPTLAPDGSRVAAIDADGNVRLGAPGTQGAIVALGALTVLPGTTRPGRVLWQPGRDALLYPTGTTENVTLTLKDLAGGTRTVVSGTGLLDAAFSPDGSLLLTRDPHGFAVWDVAKAGPARFSWPDGDPLAVAYWSPRGRCVLVQDTSGSQLVNLAAQSVTPLLVYGSEVNAHATRPPRWWHPSTGSPWSADGTAIVFAAASGDRWGGSPLPASGGGQMAGLYVGAIAGDGKVGAARLIEAGNDLAPSWSYADPSTVPLLPS
jgi:hypothetical protein